MANLIYEQKLIPEKSLNKIESQVLNIFWAGFGLYTIGFTIGTTGIISLSLAQLSQLFGIILFVPAAIALIKFNLENNYLKVIYTLYCVWLLIVVLRGFSFEYNAIKKTLFDPYNGIFLYLAPLIILFPEKLVYYKKIFITIAVLISTYLLLDIFFLKKLTLAGDDNSKTILEYFAKTLGIPTGFLLFVYPYLPKKLIYLAIISFFLTVLLAVINARRGLMFMAAIIIVFAFIIFCYNNRKNIIDEISYIISFVIGIFIVANILVKNDIEFFSFIKERIGEDTRTVVELFFYDDMNGQDWLIGRGMNGLVAAPLSLYDENVEGKPGYRDGIETDYLKIILKGGVISLSLLLLIAIPAIFIGLFYSKNILSKASAFWILLWILSLYPSNVTNFTMSYLLVWISIGICYSKKIREKPNIYILNAFK